MKRFTLSRPFSTHIVLISLVAFTGLFGLFMGGCAISPSYTVTIDNQSSKSVLARIERRPSMNNMVVLESVRVKSEDLVVLGPAKAPLLERVYIVIQSPDNLHALSESHKLMPGTYRVTVSDGSVSTWGAYEVSVERE